MPYIISSGITSGGIILKNNSMTVLNGGMANDTTVNSGGSFLVSGGGSANGTTVNSGGSFLVSRGGTANDTTVNSGGSLNVDGTANDTRVNAGGYMLIFRGVAERVIENGGYVEVRNHEAVSFAANEFVGLELTVNQIATVHSGTTATGTAIGPGGCLDVYAGGIANDNVISDSIYSVCNLNVSSGGTANNTVISCDGRQICRLRVYDGGIVNNTDISGCRVEVNPGATANDTTVNSGGSLSVNGTANGTTVNSGGMIDISRDGTANNTTVNSGGSLNVNGTANDTTVNSGGSLNVNGTANDTTVNSGGSLNVNGTASGTTVSGGIMFVSGDGKANDLRVYDGGRLVVLSGAQIGSATIGSGATVTGNIDCNGVAFESGAILNFDIREYDLEKPEALVTNIPSASDGICYSLTVSGDQKEGTYQLAEGVSGFDQTVAVNCSDMQTGVVSLDETVRINGDDYTLRLTDGDLILDIEADKTVTQYVYLDFDGENSLRYRNQDLNLSFTLSVRNSGISEERRQAILSALSEQYAENGIVFTLERPADTEYSTLFFGTTGAFDQYGDFYGVAETHDGNNRNKGDCAYILLDQSYSDGQIASVASHMLDHLLGYSFMADGTPALKKYAESKYLLSTEWRQRSPYNKYCPIDPKTGDRCLTGCTNTASGQIINYWIEKGMLDFSLRLEDSDAYTSKKNSEITIDGSAKPGAGYLSFSEINKLLADYKPGNEDSIAALCFAAGVIQKASYSSDATSTYWKDELFLRSGLETFRQSSYSFYGSIWPESAESYQGENIRLSDNDFIIQELYQGRPVAISIKESDGQADDIDSSHALVLDGYDSSANKFHLNYGWGGDSNGWYSLKELNDRGVYFVMGIVPEASPVLEVKDLSFNAAFVDRSEDVTLRFSVANTGKTKSDATAAVVCCGDKFLESLDLAFVSPGFSRDLTCTVKASDLSAGENTITVKVYSQKDEEEVSSLSGTVRVYDGAISDADNTWQLAAAGGDRTRIAAEYDADGNVAETVLAEGEYIGSRDRVDFREVTLEHAGKYTFTLSGFSNDLEFALYSLTAKGNLKPVKSIFVFAPDDTAVLSEVPLEKGTCYLSVRAANEETPGDSDYRFVFSGTGYLKADDSDDWKDLEQEGIDGAVGFVGVIVGTTTELITDGWVGLGDEFDYRLFRLPCSVNASFTVTASDAVKFTVYEIREKTSKKGVTTYSLKSLQSTKVKAGAPVNTKGLLLSPGDAPDKYCFSVQSTNASKGGSADYSVSFNQADSEFFSKGDNSDDWDDVKTAGALGAVGDAGVIADGTEEVLSGWVGFGDAVDYKSFSVSSGAKLSFTLGAGDKTRFTVWKLNSKTDKKGVTTWTLKSLQATSLAKDKKSGTFVATTKTLLLDEGTYYLSVESTNAKKGGSADYAVNLNGGASVFYVDADDGANGFLYGKKTGLNNTLYGSDAFVIHSNSLDIQLDSEKPGVDGRDNFVGYGDEADFRKIRLETDAVVSFSATASDACKFVICSLAESVDRKGDPKYTVKTLQTTKLSKPKDTAEYAATTKALELAAGEYYIAMLSTNVKKGGAAYYNVSLNTAACSGLSEGVLDAQNASALSCQDAPDFGTGGGADFASEKLFGENGNGLLACL